MNKKDYVLKVLSIMKDSRPIAEGLSYLIEKNTFDETILDVLIKILQYSLQKVSSENEKEKLIKAQSIFEKIKQSEKAQQQIDEKDIQNLEDMITTL